MINESEQFGIYDDDVFINGDIQRTYVVPPTPSPAPDLDGLTPSTNDMGDDDLIVSKENGGSAWVKKTAVKLWNYIKTKLGISAQGSTGKYLDEQGNFTTPPNTTYGVVSKTADGLAPQLPNETTTTKYLRQDGEWAVPPDNNTTYSNGTGLDLSGTTFSVNGVKDKGNNTNIKFEYSGNGNSAPDYYCVWDGYRVTYASKAEVKAQIDTNTWRGIQNNLNSTSTSDSLSAYQGKLLKGYIDNILTYEKLGSGSVTAANSWQTKSLDSGKKFSNWRYIIVCLCFYGNTNCTIIEPYERFVSHGSTGNRIFGMHQDGSGIIVEVYKYSDTQFAMKQSAYQDNRSVVIFGAMKNI